MRIKIALDEEAYAPTRAHDTDAGMDHIPEHMERENLKALCAPCHLRYDAKQHAESKKKKARRR